MVWKIRLSFHVAVGDALNPLYIHSKSYDENMHFILYDTGCMIIKVGWGGREFFSFYLICVCVER